MTITEDELKAFEAQAREMSEARPGDLIPRPLVTAAGAQALGKTGLALVAEVRRLREQDEVHWKTRRSLLAERDAWRGKAERAEAALQETLRSTPTYERMKAALAHAVEALESCGREARWRSKSPRPTPEWVQWSLDRIEDTARKAVAAVKEMTGEGGGKKWRDALRDTNL